MTSRSAQELLFFPSSTVASATAVGKSDLLLAILLLLSPPAFFVSGQTTRLCEGELGEAGWACDSLTPIPLDVFETFSSLPGSPDPSNPTTYKQIDGDPVVFDEATGERNGTTNSAVFVLTEGTYFCMLVESNGEAALFDAPEGEDNKYSQIMK